MRRYTAHVAAGLAAASILMGVLLARATSPEPVPLPVTWFNEHQMESFRKRVDTHVAAYTTYDKEGRPSGLSRPFDGEGLMCIYVEKSHLIYVGFGFRFDGVVVWRYESPERAAAFEDSLLRLGGAR